MNDNHRSAISIEVLENRVKKLERQMVELLKQKTGKLVPSKIFLETYKDKTMKK